MDIKDVFNWGDIFSKEAERPHVEDYSKEFLKQLDDE